MGGRVSVAEINRKRKRREDERRRGRLRAEEQRGLFGLARPGWSLALSRPGALLRFPHALQPGRTARAQLLVPLGYLLSCRARGGGRLSPGPLQALQDQSQGCSFNRRKGKAGGSSRRIGLQTFPGRSTAAHLRAPVAFPRLPQNRDEENHRAQADTRCPKAQADATTRLGQGDNAASRTAPTPVRQFRPKTSCSEPGKTACKTLTCFKKQH